MSATTNAIAKIAAVAAGLALVASSFAAFAPSARAATAAELEAQVQALLAQIAALGGGSASASTTFTMDLTLGSSGAEVTALQNFLIAGGYSIPAGATGYFGAQTQAALAAYQAANGISPAAGYFGPITRAKVNAAGGSTGGSTGGTSGLGGGEASLEDLEASSGAADEVSEGETAEVAEFEFDVEDGDIRIERVDLTFTTTNNGTTEEDEPWETFETITILDADGDEIASEDVSDEDEWLEDDSPFQFRFSGLDYVVEEGETGALIVEVEAQSSVDGADETNSWTVEIGTDDLRGIDGEGIDQYLGDGAEEVTFDVVEEGEGEELNISASSEDPDASTLQVEEDDLSDWYTIFTFELDAEEADVELNDLGINLVSSDSDVDTVVNDAMLVIDGEEFDDFDWGGITNAAYASTTFDIDGDVEVGDGETVTVEFMVEFKAQSGNYATGTTISASTTGSLIEAEGADDITVDGSAQGETHTLQIDGIIVTPSSDSAETTVVDSADNDYAEYEIEVEIEAVGDDVFISQTGTTAFTLQFENASDGSVISTSTATTTTISSSADTSGSAYRVNEGETETFTFMTSINPLTTDEGKSIRMQLLTINFGETSTDPDSSSWTATPAGDYETNGTLISD
jgi:peptidoglycan hydrolase-like protein with peptidoglycan-binding domain